MAQKLDQFIESEELSNELEEGKVDNKIVDGALTDSDSKYSKLCTTV